MKDEYLKAYQQRIEEIKTLDVSPEEKRKLAADAKNEILDQYKSSYIKEKEEAAKKEADVKQTASATEEADPIGNILNKLEEREERGEVGVELEQPTAFLDPEALFSTMDLGELFASLGIEDDGEVEDGDDNAVLEDLDDIFMDTDQLFAGLLDEAEEEVDSQAILNEFDLDADTQPLEPQNALDTQTIAAFNNITEEPIVEEVIVEDQEEPISEVEEIIVEDEIVEDEIVEDEIVEGEIVEGEVIEDTIGETQIVSSVETVVEEVEELTEGTIIDDSEEVEEAADLDPESINELEELEKERERAQKLGAIEMALLVVLIILVIIVVYLIIGV